MSKDKVPRLRLAGPSSWATPPPLYSRLPPDTSASESPGDEGAVGLTTVSPSSPRNRIPPPPRPPVLPDETAPLPVMRDTGEPGVPVECIMEPRSHSLAFYYLPSHPDKLCCGRCFERVRGSHLARMFMRTEQAVVVCAFGGYRMKGILDSAAAAGEEEAHAAVVRIRTVLDSMSPAGCGEPQGFARYTLTAYGRQYPICSHCFATMVADSAFAHRVTLGFEGAVDMAKRAHRAQPGQDVASSYPTVCILKTPYVQRAWTKLAHADVNLSAFTLALQRRLRVVPCQSDKSVFLTPRDRLDFDVCEECFLDNVGYTRFAPEFVPSSRTVCRLGYGERGSMQLAVALDTAVRFGDFETFRAAATSIAEAHADLHTPAVDVLADVTPEFVICEPCHAGYMMPTGLGRFFSHKHTGDTTVACDLCGSDTMLNALVHALDTGVWEVFRAAAFETGALRVTRADEADEKEDNH